MEVRKGERWEQEKKEHYELGGSIGFVYVVLFKWREVSSCYVDEGSPREVAKSPLIQWSIGEIMGVGKK